MSYPWNQARLYHPHTNKTVEEYRYRRPLHSSAMKELLGLGAKAKLPREGMDPVYIQGVKVWVNPEPMARTFQREAGMKMKHSATHRVRCNCPMCGEEMSAGRLNQHTCK